MSKEFAPWKRFSSWTVITSLNVLAGCALFFEGWNQGVMGGVNGTPEYINTVDIGSNGTITNVTRQGGIVSVYYFGAVFGALFSGWLSDKIGRKRGLFFGSLWCMLGAALMSAAQNGNWMICARVITGFGTGHLNCITPALVAETSETHTRGRSIALTFLANYIGIVVVYWLQFGLRWVDGPFRWRFPLATMVITPLILAIGIFCVPESPRWLVKEGRIEEALEVVCKLRGDAPPTDAGVQAEMAEMQTSVEKAREMAASQSLFKMAFGIGSGKLHLGRRTFLAIGVMILMEWTGVLAITVYANNLFAIAGYDTTKAAWLSGLCNTIGILGTLAAAYTIDLLGRRQLLFIGAIIQSIALFLVGGFAAGAKSHPDKAAAFGAASATMLFIFTFFFAATWLQVAFTYPAEIWPTEMRAKGNSFGVVGWAIGCGWTTLLIPIMFDNLGEKTLYVFGALNAAMIPVVYALFPETSGRSLESINYLFASRSPFVWEEEKEFTRLMAEAESEGRVKEVFVENEKLSA